MHTKLLKIQLKTLDSKLNFDKQNVFFLLSTIVFIFVPFFRLARQVPEDELFSEVVDIEDGISKNTRCLYPKVGGKTKVLNEFLNRRLQLKSLEERRFELHSGAKPDPASPATKNNTAKNDEVFSKFVDESKKTPFKGKGF